MYIFTRRAFAGLSRNILRSRTPYKTEARTLPYSHFFSSHSVDPAVIEENDQIETPRQTVSKKVEKLTSEKFEKKPHNIEKNASRLGEKRLFNQEIRSPKVIVITDEGERLGEFLLSDALAMAKSKDLDLVQMTRDTHIPICKIMDYGRYSFQKQKRAKAGITPNLMMKEVKLSSKIDKHDLDRKVESTIQFLKKGHQVKIFVKAGGRRPSDADNARDVLAEVCARLEDCGDWEDLVTNQNTQIMFSPFMIFTPKKPKPPKRKAAEAMIPTEQAVLKTALGTSGAKVTET